MKLKKILGGLVLCLLCILTVAVLENKPTDAAENIITLSMASGKKTHTYDYINAHIAIKASDIKKVEFQQGKVKSTSDKKWKVCVEWDFTECEDDPDCSFSTVSVGANGYFSIRVTTVSGKKYVKSIKVKNILDNADLCEFRAVITNISEADKDGYYTLTADLYEQFAAHVSEVIGKKVGDTINIYGFDCTITDIIKFDENGEIQHVKKVTDYTCRPILTTEYNNSLPKSFKDNPYFGLVCLYATHEYFNAYDDYEWEDCYSPFCYKYDTNTKFRVNKKTKVYLADYDFTQYGSRYYLPANKYISLIGNTKKQEKLNIHIYDHPEYYFYPSYNAKTDEASDYLEEIEELYSP